MPSSVITRMVYEPARGMLVIHFTSGARYAYFDVPQETWRAFQAAASKGRYFAAEIPTATPTASSPPDPTCIQAGGWWRGRHAAGLSTSRPGGRGSPSRAGAGRSA